MDIEQALQTGIEHHKEGRLGDAVRCYKSVLEHDPANVDALNLMSVMAATAGDFPTAAMLARNALAGQPDWFLSYVNLGNAYKGMNQLGEAVDAFQKAVTLNPGSAESHINLSDALNALGKHAEAADMAVQAIVINPEAADAHVNFGNALSALGSPGEAAEAYQKAIRLEPDNSLAWFNLGIAHLELGEAESSAQATLRSIALVDGAVKRYNLALAEVALGRRAEAVESYRKALELDGGLMDAWVNLGALLRDLGRLDEAAATLREGLSRAPDEAELHWNLAISLLTAGAYAEGWAEYEWRWRTPHFARFVRPFSQPEWQGEDLAGKSILIHAEQGYGDAIEMARFLPGLAQSAERVYLECRPGLGRLFEGLDPRIAVSEVGTRDLPATDFHLPMMSLPHVLGLTLETVPAPIPYLRSPGNARDRYPDVAAAEGLKVAVVWSGSATRGDNQPRSFRPHDLLELGDMRLFSLQKDDTAATASDLFDHGLMVDLGQRLTDFADTAMAIELMDLVITADTAVAHLAGAMGKKVWILLPNPTNAFLWMQDRSDSPWYPTARLFRQTTPGDWSGVMAELQDALVSSALL